MTVCLDFQLCSIPDLLVRPPLYINRPGKSQFKHDLLKDDKTLFSSVAEWRGEELSGTALAIYRLLRVMVNEVGWDDVLDIRQSSFVMEQDHQCCANE